MYTFKHDYWTCLVAATSCMYFRLSSLLKLKCALHIFLKSWKAWGLTVHSSHNIYWLCIFFFFFFSWQILNFWINTGDTWRIFTLFDSNLPCPHYTVRALFTHPKKHLYCIPENYTYFLYLLSTRNSVSLSDNSGQTCNLTLDFSNRLLMIVWTLLIFLFLDSKNYWNTL